MSVAANNRIRVNDQAPHPVLRQVSQIFQEHYKDPQFINKLNAHGFFTSTLDRGSQVADKILKDQGEITLNIANLKGRTIASTDIGARSITFDLESLTPSKNASPAQQKALIRARVKTLMHEYIHTLGYKHAGNGNNWFNKKSAPYKVAEIFVQDLTRRHVL